MKKIFYFLSVILFSSALFAQVGISTVYTKTNAAASIQGRQTLATTLSLSFSVAANTYCDVSFSFHGVNSAGAGVRHVMQVKQGSNPILFIPSLEVNTAAGAYRQGNSFGPIRLEAGSYTYDSAVAAFDASSGNAAYYGSCYNIR